MTCGPVHPNFYIPQKTHPAFFYLIYLTSSFHDGSHFAGYWVEFKKLGGSQLPPVLTEQPQELGCALGMTEQITFRAKMESEIQAGQTLGTCVRTQARHRPGPALIFSTVTEA